jgi:hypothetical protein
MGVKKQLAGSNESGEISRDGEDGRRWKWLDIIGNERMMLKGATERLKLITRRGEPLT